MMILIATCVSLEDGKTTLTTDEVEKWNTRNMSEAWSQTAEKVVVMGSRTFDEWSAKSASAPAAAAAASSALEQKNLDGRTIFVLTRTKSQPLNFGETIGPGIYFVSLNDFLKFYSIKCKPTTYFVGGFEIFHLFWPWVHEIILFKTTTPWIDFDSTIIEESLYSSDPESARPHEIKTKCLQPLAKDFVLVHWKVGDSSVNETTLLHYRNHVRINKNQALTTLTKYENPEEHAEYRYLLLLRKVLSSGMRPDRTQIGTYSVFGTQLRFDIRTTIPLLTTKRVSFKGVIEELLWILQGHTDAKILARRGVKIWNANTSRDFLDGRGLDYPEGVLGPGYGFQLRFFGATYAPEYADMSNPSGGKSGIGSATSAKEWIGGVDQLAAVERLLHKDPFSRRILISMWNPAALDATALVPCHYSIQFYVEEAAPGDADRRHWLSCMLTMRSNDLVCGFPWNIASYSVLTWILAMRAGMRPKDIVYSCGDAHIYANHERQVKEQLLREPRPFPGLRIDASVATKDWSEMTRADFSVVGYFPHPAIPAPMAV
jgi:thymidylate synthase